jgi:DNA-binding beta-propeller fold protein YncE
MKKPFFISGIMALLIFVLSSNSFGDDRWISIGPEGGPVPALAINPQTPSILYAGGGGAFKSTNGGANWFGINTGITNTSILAVAIDPQTTDTLYAGTASGGVFKSTNGGGNWTAINTGLTDTLVRALAINPQIPDTLYAGTEGGGVFKTTNGGMNWTAMNSGLTSTLVRTLAINPQTTDTLYAGTDGGIFKSTDGGTTWTDTGLTNPYDPDGPRVHTLAIDPQTPDTLYAGIGSGVFKSTNGGANWTTINTGLTNTYVHALAIDPQAPDTLYAGIGSGVFKSTNGGTNWFAINTGLTNTRIQFLAIDPQTPRILYAGTYGASVFKIRQQTIPPEAYKFERMWGSQGVGNGQFNSPTGVAVDSLGNVYAADYGNHRIQKFNPNGNYITQWSSPGDSYFAQSVAVDPAGNIYVVANETTIKKFDPKGNLITAWENSFNCLGRGQIATDSLGNVYATINCPCYVATCPGFIYRVRKVDSNGNLMVDWGELGAGDGQFWYPRGVATDASGNVYVADTGNNRIQKFDSNGNFISKWSIEGADEGQFSAPYAISTDSGGNVYVSIGNDRIQKFDSRGNLITEWGYWGRAEGQFDGPGGIAVDSLGNVYVADSGNDRIEKFSPDEQGLIPLPDLIGQWTSLIQRCRYTPNGPKCTITGNLRVQNTGNQNAPSSSVRFYLSTDAYIDGTDLFLKQVATGSVKMGKSKSKMLSHSFPLGETASRKYIIAVIDAGNTVTESDKSNNYAVFGPIQ